MHLIHNVIKEMKLVFCVFITTGDAEEVFEYVQYYEVEHEDYDYGRGCCCFLISRTS